MNHSHRVQLTVPGISSVTSDLQRGQKSPQRHGRNSLHAWQKPLVLVAWGIAVMRRL
jgi:hypothetical protein